MKALVYYADGVSGKAVAARLAERGDEVVPVDRTLGNEDDLALLDGVDVVVKTPGVPPRDAAARARRASAACRSGRRSSSGSGCCRARGSSASPARTARRRPRALLGAIFRGGRARRHGRREHRRPAHVRARGRLGRLRALVVPARGRAHCSPARSRCCSTSSRDHLDRYDSFDDYRDAKLRIFERARAKVVPRGLGSRGHRVRGRRPAAGRAADPRRAQPRERRRRDRRGARGRDRRRRDRRGAAHVPGRAAPARGRSARPAACASSTTRRRRTSPPRAARSRRTRTSRCT